jgi:hypothetical protein
MANGTTNFVYTAQDGLFKMAWNDLDAMLINNNEVLLVLKMKSKDLAKLTQNIQLDLFEESEIADSEGNVSPYTVLMLSDVRSSAIGVNESGGLSGFTVHPNPTTNITFVDFTLSTNCKAKICLMDVIGNTLRTLADAPYASGNHRLEFNAETLAKGIYLLKIEITSNGLTTSNMHKIVVSN